MAAILLCMYKTTGQFNIY